MLVVLALIVFGSSAMLTTPMELIPDIEMPMLIVMTMYPNAAPQDVETLVSSVIEDACETLPGVKHVQSVSSENVSMVALEFNYGTNLEEAKSNLRGNLDMYSFYLPDDIQSPTIIEIRMDMMATMALSATPKGDIDLLTYVEEYIKPEVEKIDGVGNISVSGSNKDYISISLDQEAMRQYGLSLSTVAQMVSAADFSIPAGNIGQGELELILRGSVSYPTVASLQNIPLTLRSGDIIQLSDVAKVYQAAAERTSISRTNGEPDVMLEIMKRQSASTLSMTSAVKRAVERINARSIGVELTVIYDASVMILSAITSVAQTMLLGIFLAMAVIYLFFGEWKASLIVGTSIPLSLLVTLVAMQMMGFTFNMLSLGGLVIGVGMMVDNSIVVIESCFRAKKEGRTFRDAAIDGTKIVASSIFASTLTTVVVFLPIPFIEGMTGQMFGELCFTIVFSLAASLLSAITLAPLVFYRLAPQEKEFAFVQKHLGRLEDAYVSFLPKTLRRKKTVVVVAVLLLAVSIAIIPLIGMELFAATDEGTVVLAIDARPGLKLDKLDELIAPVEQMVAAHPDVERYSVTAGGMGMSTMTGGASSSATVTAYLREGRKMSTTAVVDEFRRETASLLNCSVTVTQSSMTAMMSGGTGIQIPMQSRTYADLERSSLVVEELLRNHPDIISVSSTVNTGNPQAEIKVDPIRAGAAGLLPAQIMGEVYSIMEGKETGRLNLGGRDYSIRVEFPKDLYSDVSDLYSLTIQNPMGMEVPLMDVATVEYSNSPQSITKLNGSYIVTVTGQPSSTASVKLGSQLNEQAKQLPMPEGVEVGTSTQLEEMQREFMTLLGAILTAAFLVFLVMAMQFESPRFSIVVMLCVPFSLIGSFGSLLLFGATLSLPSLMGFLMLIGIVVNNGILFIDTANRLRIEENIPPEQALAQAGRLRMRPILMTTLTTVLAMVPMAIGVGANGALMRGMALVIIGGLTASTVLALLLLPSFYLLFDKKTAKKKKLGFKKKAAQA